MHLVNHFLLWCVTPVGGGQGSARIRSTSSPPRMTFVIGVAATEHPAQSR
jgi:hypothetical protein